MQGLPVNKDFFSFWSREMSYILGFITADGCLGVGRIRKRDNRKQYYLNITNKEKRHLENIKKAMASHHTIFSKRSGYTGKKDSYFIQIGHQEICKDLLKLGIQPRKTYNLNPIKVPEKFFPDFVRGFFDGDGTVYIYEVNGTPQIKASFKNYNNLDFIINLNRRLCKVLSISQKAVHQEISKKGEIGYYFDFYIDDCERLAKFMYRNNPTLYLPRKRKIFEKWESIRRRDYIKQNYPSKVGWHLNQKVFA